MSNETIRMYTHPSQNKCTESLSITQDNLTGNGVINTNVTTIECESSSDIHTIHYAAFKNNTVSVDITWELIRH